MNGVTEVRDLGSRAADLCRLTGRQVEPFATVVGRVAPNCVARHLRDMFRRQALVSWVSTLSGFGCDCSPGRIGDSARHFNADVGYAAERGRGGRMLDGRGLRLTITPSSRAVNAMAMIAFIVGAPPLNGRILP